LRSRGFSSNSKKVHLLTVLAISSTTSPKVADFDCIVAVSTAN
jgi:hypothetical protein